MSTNKSVSRRFKPFLLLIHLGGSLTFLVMILHRAVFDVKSWQYQAITEIKEHKDTAYYLNKSSLVLPHNDSSLAAAHTELSRTEVDIGIFSTAPVSSRDQVERLQQTTKVPSEQMEPTEIVWAENGSLREEIASCEACPSLMSASLPTVRKYKPASMPWPKRPSYRSRTINSLEALYSYNTQITNLRGEKVSLVTHNFKNLFNTSRNQSFIRGCTTIKA